MKQSVHPCTVCAQARAHSHKRDTSNVHANCAICVRAELLACVRVRVCAQVSATAGLSVHYCVRSVVMSGSVVSLLVLCVRVCVIECPARVYVRGCVLRACIRISEDVCLFAWELACLSDCFTSFPDRPACRPACLHNSICLLPVWSHALPVYDSLRICSKIVSLSVWLSFHPSSLLPFCIRVHLG